VAAAAVVLAVVEIGAQVPAFPGSFVRHAAVSATVAERECLALGDNMFDQDVRQIGACRALGLHDAGHADTLAWGYAIYERRWLQTPTDTTTEREVVLFTRQVSGDTTRLRPVWHYRYEAELLVSAKPEVARAAGGGVLLSIDECVNGTGGCSQSFAILGRGSPKVVRLAFLDSLNRRFPGGIRHGFHVDVQTLRGSLGLYSDRDANCCPSAIGAFSLRLRNHALELATLRTRRAD